jgi:outer membrane protein assembly factor BamB
MNIYHDVRRTGHTFAWTLCATVVLLSLLLSACGTPTRSSPKATTQATRLPTPRKEPAMTTPTPTAVLAQITPGDWPTYLMGNGRGGFNRAETLLTETTAPELRLHWTAHVSNPISSQPISAFGMIFWGSWDGLEHATSGSGQEIWATNLGRTHACGATIGVASTAIAALVTIKGRARPMLFVGGGNASFYALDALTGAIVWKTALGSPPAPFLWSSPVTFHGSVYIGLSSLGDCPTVQGKLFQLNEVTGAVQHVFDVVPNGCIGGGVWSSPSIDEQTGDLYIAIGSPDTCWTSEPYVSSLMAFHASDLSLISYWQVPQSQWVIDSDFGSAPTLFTARIRGSLHAMVGIAHKNGIYYALDRDNISAGPLWQASIAQGGSCPACGQGSISPSAWDGSKLYVAGGNTVIQGAKCAGGLRALNPADGTFIWEHCLLSGPVLGAVTAVPGLVVVGEGSSLVVMSAQTGKTLFVYTDTHNQATFAGPASISHGMLYIGNFDGNLYAFGL